jgi:hypothetical protein
MAVGVMCLAAKVVLTRFQADDRRLAANTAGLNYLKYQTKLRTIAQKPNRWAFVKMRFVCL